MARPMARASPEVRTCSQKTDGRHPTERDGKTWRRLQQKLAGRSDATRSSAHVAMHCGKHDACLPEEQGPAVGGGSRCMLLICC